MDYRNTDLQLKLTNYSEQSYIWTTKYSRNYLNPKYKDRLKVYSILILDMYM